LSPPNPRSRSTFRAAKGLQTLVKPQDSAPGAPSGASLLLNEHRPSPWLNRRGRRNPHSPVRRPMTGRKVRRRREARQPRQAIHPWGCPKLPPFYKRLGDRNSHCHHRSPKERAHHGSSRRPPDRRRRSSRDKRSSTPTGRKLPQPTGGDLFANEAASPPSPLAAYLALPSRSTASNPKLPYLDLD